MNLDLDALITEGCKSSTTCSKMEDGLDLFKKLPNELLLYYIFPSLDGATFVRCRSVCKRWKDIIDELQHKNFQKLWKDFTDNDFSHIFEGTLQSCHPDMSWCQIYKNIYLWPHIASASCTHHTLAPTTKYEIRSMQITKEGMVFAVHKEAIKFYNLQTQEPREYGQLIERHELYGNYVDYQENYIAKALLTSRDTLYITRKTDHVEDISMAYDNVCLFILHKKLIYFQVFGTVYKCDLSTPSVSTRLLIDAEQLPGGMHIVQDNLYVRTYSGDIICVDVNDSVTRIEVPQSLQHFTGIFGTLWPDPFFDSGNIRFSRSHYLNELLRNHSVLVKGASDDPFQCNNFASQSSKSLAHSNWSTVTTARIYNDMLLLGTMSGAVHIIQIYEFRHIREFKVDVVHPTGILDIKIHETPNGYDIVVLTEFCIHVLRLQHRDI